MTDIDKLRAELRAQLAGVPGVSSWPLRIGAHALRALLDHIDKLGADAQLARDALASNMDDNFKTERERDEARAELARLLSVVDFNLHASAPDPDSAINRATDRRIAELEARAEAAEKALIRFQDEVWGAFQTWSMALGWGISGNQPECYAMMDRSVDRLISAEAELARLREETAGSIMATEIDSAPEPLQRLGKWLADKLDEDDFKTAEPMLLGAVAAHSGLMKRLGQLESKVSILQSERREALVELARLRAPVTEVGEMIAWIIGLVEAQEVPGKDDALECADLLTRLAARVAEGERVMRDIDGHIISDNGDVTWSPLTIRQKIRAYLPKDQNNGR